MRGGPPAAGRLLGIDVGGTNIKRVVLADARDRSSVEHEDSVPTRGSTAHQVLDQVVELVQDAQATHGPISAVGFSLPGVVDRRKGVTGVMPNLPGAWHGVRARDHVAARVDLPTAIVNDARAFTLAEAEWGAGRGLGVVVGVTLGTGLGGGLAFGGRIFEGAHGFAGELGHQVFDPAGPPCGCGGRGCAETVVRAAALAASAGQPTVEAVFSAAGQGDPRAQQALDRYIEALAVALSNVHTLLCPDAFVVGGGIAEAGDRLLSPLERRMRALVRVDEPLHVVVRGAELGAKAGAIGAALVAGRAGDGATPLEDASRTTCDGATPLEDASRTTS